VSNYGAKELQRVARDFEKRGVQLASAQVSVLGDLRGEVRIVLCLVLLRPMSRSMAPQTGEVTFVTFECDG
jgi:hypothetical protein